jgi:hypothetical protein
VARVCVVAGIAWGVAVPFLAAAVVCVDAAADVL